MVSINDLAAAAIATSLDVPTHQFPLIKPEAAGPDRVPAKTTVTTVTTVTTISASSHLRTRRQSKSDVPPPVNMDSTTTVDGTETAVSQVPVEQAVLTEVAAVAAGERVVTPTLTSTIMAAPVVVEDGQKEGDRDGEAVGKKKKKKKKKNRGALIILEGLDRSGKSTQVKLLAQRFVEADHEVKVMRFPDRTTLIGQMIDSYLKNATDMDDHVIHLLFCANRWEAARNISALLASGTSVLCDRYYYSGVVYSAAKQNPSLSLEWARAPEVGLPRPDCVVFLDLDAEKARDRGGFGEEKYEREEMQRRVGELFRGFSTEEGGYVEEKEDLVIVDAGAGIEDVSEEIWAKVLPKVEAVEKGEYGTEVRTVS